MKHRIQIPKYNFKLRQHKGKVYLWDYIRSKYIQLSQEEWVRQNFIMFLINYKGYNKNLISVEKCFDINNQPKRYDILVYKNNEAKLLVECKSSSISLNNNIIKQVQLYSYKLKVTYIVITNGISYSCFKVGYSSTISYSVLNYIPRYSEL